MLLLVSAFALVVLASFFFRNESRTPTDAEFRAIIQGYLDKGYIVHDVFPSNIAMPALKDSFPLAAVLQGTLPSFGNFPRLKGRDYVEYIINHIVSGTEFEGKVNVNDVPMKGHINIYFLSQDEEHLSRNFDKNCTFIRIYRTVLCDAMLIESIFEQIDSIEELYDIAIITLDKATRKAIGNERPDISKDPEMREQLLSLMKGSVLTWILGHEIGHAILHYDLVGGKDRELHFDFAYDKVEEAADAFVAEQAARIDGRGAEIATLLGEFIEQEFRRHYLMEMTTVSGDVRKKLSDNNFSLLNKITVKRERGRVPLLLRALYVKKALLKKALLANSPEHGSMERYDRILENIELN